MPSPVTPWSRILLEKLTCYELNEKFHAFYGTRRFIAAVTSARHLTLSIHSIPPIPIPEYRNIFVPSTPGSSKWSLYLIILVSIPWHPYTSDYPFKSESCHGNFYLGICILSDLPATKFLDLFYLYCLL